MSLTVNYFYIKLNSFMQVSSIRIVLSGCYRLITYSIYLLIRTDILEDRRWVNLTFRRQL